MSSLSGSAVHIIPLLGVNLCKYIEDEFAPWYEPMGRHSLHVLLEEDNQKLIDYRLTVARDVVNLNFLEFIVRHDAPKCLEVAVRNLKQYIEIAVENSEDEIDDYILFNLDEIEEYIMSSFCPNIIDYLWETYETSDNPEWRELGQSVFDPQRFHGYSNNMMWRHMINNYLTEEQFIDIVEEDLSELPIERIHILADVYKELNIDLNVDVQFFMEEFDEEISLQQ